VEVEVAVAVAVEGEGAYFLSGARLWLESAQRNKYQ